MSEFEAFFWTGYEHIVAADGLDHILFIVVLAAVYPREEWRKILVLVTAFTLGHSLTLALAALQVISVNRSLIELLIPVTIFVTAILNFFEKPTLLQHKTLSQGHVIRYVLAMVFGFIHGFAFSGLLMRMFAGMEDKILWPLFAFNVGIEVGQILVVLGVILLSFIAINYLKIKAMYWNTGLSALAALAAVVIFIVKLTNS
ncbi:MAG: HupE/UreJ family protein [Microscillaceae bacterium]|nr:HupE/UreJ family protein [Microscillaceae bacterium]